MVVTAVNLADPGHDEDDAIDIADRMIVEHLTNAPGPDNSGTGWASVRVQYPKTNYPSRVTAIQVLVKSGLSHRTVARLFNIERSTITKICRDTPDDM
jgi:DNA-binding NarL/FixJ family response regulator